MSFPILMQYFSFVIFFTTYILNLFNKSERRRRREWGKEKDDKNTGEV